MRQTLQRLIPRLPLLLILLWAASAAAASAPPTPDQDAPGWMKALYEAATSGEYKIAAGLVLVGIFYAVNRWTPIKPKTKPGRIALAFVLSLSLTLGLALAAGAPLALATFTTAIGTAAGAAGVWGWIKDYLEHKESKEASSSS